MAAWRIVAQRQYPYGIAWFLKTTTSTASRNRSRSVSFLPAGTSPLDAVHCAADKSATRASAFTGFYFHGTDAETAQRIARFGFDERFSKGIYGDGLYFTPDACKAHQYATPDADDALACRRAHPTATGPWRRAA